jgi:FAD-linked sulfhydryl oxidase
MSLYNMSKSVWGPPTWRLLHCMVIKAKDIMTPPQINELKSIIERVVSNLPCPLCSGHAIAFFKKNNFQHINTLYQLRYFLFEFHNNVNKRLDKKTITYEEHMNLYQSMNLEVVLRNMLQVYQNMNNTNVTMMLYSFHRTSIIRDLNKYFMENDHLFLL